MSIQSLSPQSLSGPAVVPAVAPVQAARVRGAGAAGVSGTADRSRPAISVRRDGALDTANGVARTARARVLRRMPTIYVVVLAAHALVLAGIAMGPLLEPRSEEPDDAVVVEMVAAPPAPTPPAVSVPTPQLTPVMPMAVQPARFQPISSPSPSLRVPGLNPAAPPAQPAAAASAATTATTVTGSSGVTSGSWDGQLVAHFNRHMRMPRGVRAGRDNGVAMLRFTLDRNGRVLAHRLERSSGSELLDAEVESLVVRAAPFPQPPEDQPGQTFERLIPLRFHVR